VEQRVAVLGAGGFVGSRLVEVMHLSGSAEVVPVVRRVPAMARSSRFDLAVALADASDPEALANALAGCDAVVDCTVGMPAAIEAGARALIPAAAAAGVPRVVYLSSASVHGQNPPLGTTEASALSDRQEMAYNNAKVRAERRLFADASRSGVELFVLRPSIVFGPRDRWLTTLVAELQAGTAWLIDGGRGICNTIYVDNLIEAIRCSLNASASAAGSPYLVGDAEEITWGSLYEQTAAALGIDSSSVHHLPVPPAPVRSAVDFLNELRVQPASQRLIAAVPSRLKSAAKGALSGLKPVSSPNPWALPSHSPVPVPSREMVLLQQCRHRFSHAKAIREIDYWPCVSFAEGLQRTLQWMAWAQLV
jgi:nucleoside-diphosphate-sugar epimerase